MSFIAVYVIVAKRQQPIPTAKTVFSGGGGENNHALRCELNLAIYWSFN